MKIGIVTIYNGFNYGCFYQVSALCHILECMGHEVKVVKHSARMPAKDAMLSIGKRCLKLQFKEVPFFISLYKNLAEAHRDLSYCGLNEVDEMDLIIFGSDEIWNIRRNWKHDVFWGLGINNRNKVSYAPSINNSDTKDFEKYPELVKSIQSFKCISVRDIKSQRVIQSLVNKKVQTVLDPSILLDKSIYHSWEKEIIINGKFILVYSYNKGFDGNIVRKITSFSKENKLKLVSVCTYFKWCDYSLGLSPMQTLNLFHNAEFVITNTFHGVMFSTIYEKDILIPQVTTDKLREIIKYMGYENRVMQGDDSVDEILMNHIDYERVNIVINKEREKSLRYIKEITHKEKI